MDNALKITIGALSVICIAIIFVLIYKLVNEYTSLHLLRNLVSTIDEEDDNVDFDIDAVITWVDSNDPVFMQRRNKALGLLDNDEEGASHLDLSEQRDNYFGEAEINICMDLILINLPWIRNIYLVTANQKPKSLSSRFKQYVDTGKIQVVDHSEMGIGEVFNSVAIEAGIHRIKGLAENFIYFNDDMFVSRKLRKSKFFTRGGSAILSGHVISSGVIDAMSVANSTFAKSIMNTLRILEVDGIHALFQYEHVMVPLTKTMMINAEQKFPVIWRKSETAVFRDESIPPILLSINNAILSKDAPVASGNMRLKVFVTNSTTVAKLFPVMLMGFYEALCFNTQDEQLLKKIENVVVKMKKS